MSEHRLRFGVTHSGASDRAAWIADARRTVPASAMTDFAPVVAELAGR